MSGRVLTSILRIAPGAVPWGARPSVLPSVVPVSGRGERFMIKGIVTSDGAPASRRVRLYEQRCGTLVAETWSDAVTGAYSFEWLPREFYVAIALDHTGAFDPAAKADLVAEQMP